MKIQRDANGYRIIPDEVDVPLTHEMHCTRCGAPARRCCKAESGKDARMPHRERDLAAHRYQQITGSSKTDKEITYEKLLALIHLYIDWRYVTRNLTTEEREFMADAIDAEQERLALVEGWDFNPVGRWWRDDAPAPQHSWDGLTITSRALNTQRP